MAPGQQKVSGIYKRPWEPMQYNETTYSLNVDVSGSNFGHPIFPGINGNSFMIGDMLKDIRFPDMSFSQGPLQFKNIFPL